MPSPTHSSSPRISRGCWRERGSSSCRGVQRASTGRRTRALSARADALGQSQGPDTNTAFPSNTPSSSRRSAGGPARWYGRSRPRFSTGGLPLAKPRPRRSLRCGGRRPGGPPIGGLARSVLGKKTREAPLGRSGRPVDGWLRRFKATARRGVLDPWSRSTRCFARWAVWGPGHPIRRPLFPLRWPPAPPSRSPPSRSSPPCPWRPPTPMRSPLGPASRLRSRRPRS